MVTKQRKRFEYYLRSCKICNDVFKAKSKLSRVCPNCSKGVQVNKIKQSLISRGIACKE